MMQQKKRKCHFIYENGNDSSLHRGQKKEKKLSFSFSKPRHMSYTLQEQTADPLSLQPLQPLANYQKRKIKNQELFAQTRIIRYICKRKLF